LIKKIILFGLSISLIYCAIVLYFYTNSTISQLDDSYEILLRRNTNKSAQTLFIGNSRFMFGIDKSILRNTNVFNRKGCTAAYYLPMLKYYNLHNSKPKKVIISIGYGSMYLGKGFCKVNPTFCSLINQKNFDDNFFIKYKEYLLGLIYPKNLFQDKFLKPNKINFKENNKINRKQKSYAHKNEALQKNLSLNWYKNIGNPTNYAKTYDLTVVNSLKQLSKYCKSENIELIVIKEPLHHNLLEVIYNAHPNWVNEEKFILDQLKSEYQTIKFYNFENYYKNVTGIFFDTNHLNKRGRTVFTKHLSQVLSINE